MREGRAAVLEAVGQAVRLTEVHVHAPPAGHVLLRMVAARVGEADRAAWVGAFSGRLPLVLGAEGAGVVEAVAPDVERIAVGDHVVVTDERSFVPARAGVSASFRPVGTYATYACVPARRLVRVHPSLSLHRVAEAGGATLAGYAAGLHAAGRAEGGSVLVVGLGEVGQGAVTAAIAGRSARVVAVDRRPRRLRWAEALGAEAIDAGRGDLGRAVRAAAGGHGADAAIVTGDTGGPRVRVSGLVRAGAPVLHAARLTPWAAADGAAPDGVVGEDAESLLDRFARDRLAVGALRGPDGELEDLSELLAAGEGTAAPAPLLELGFDMP